MARRRGGRWWLRWGLPFGVFFLAACNITPLPVWIGLKSSAPTYRYESSDGVFYDVENPANGHGLKRVEANFRGYLREERLDGSIVLNRTFDREPFWKFWEWKDSLTNPRWKLPYKPPKTP